LFARVAGEHADPAGSGHARRLPWNFDRVTGRRLTGRGGSESGAPSPPLRCRVRWPLEHAAAEPATATGRTQQPDGCVLRLRL